ncbi:MAG: TonB family protein [Acidobacteriaceae bacterium]|nr:TonB family protein [Acidobacteriaceae bacterium]
MFFPRAVVALAVMGGLPLAAQWGPQSYSETQPKMYAPGFDKNNEPGKGPQGTVVLGILIDAIGNVARASVLSPIGHGLDEKALEAVRKWKFRPAKDGSGNAVPCSAVVEVNFRLVTTPKSDPAEQQRLTGYAAAIHNLSSADPDSRNAAIEKLKELADQHFGPAMYEIGKRQISGDDGLKIDVPAGIKIMQEAADLDDADAAEDLAFMYARGEHVGRDLEQSRYYFELCGRAGRADCQYQVAQSVLQDARTSDDQRAYALAWAQLAADQGHPGAQELFSTFKRSLTAEQRAKFRTALKVLQGANKPTR